MNMILETNRVVLKPEALFQIRDMFIDYRINNGGITQSAFGLDWLKINPKIVSGLELKTLKSVSKEDWDKIVVFFKIQDSSIFINDNPDPLQLKRIENGVKSAQKSKDLSNLKNETITESGLVTVDIFSPTHEVFEEKSFNFVKQEKNKKVQKSKQEDKTINLASKIKELQEELDKKDQRAVEGDKLVTKLSDEIEKMKVEMRKLANDLEQGITSKKHEVGLKKLNEVIDNIDFACMETAEESHRVQAKYWFFRQVYFTLTGKAYIHGETMFEDFNDLYKAIYDGVQSIYCLKAEEERWKATHPNSPF